MFAKLFDSEKHGQILVKSDTGGDEYKPEIRFYFESNNPRFGICSIALTYTDDDGGFDKRDAAFETIDLLFAEKVVNETKQRAGI
jgi:hypothetical protein